MGHVEPITHYTMRTGLTIVGSIFRLPWVSAMSPRERIYRNTPLVDGFPDSRVSASAIRQKLCVEDPRELIAPHTPGHKTSYCSLVSTLSLLRFILYAHTAHFRLLARVARLMTPGSTGRDVEPRRHRCSGAMAT